MRIAVNGERREVTSHGLRPLLHVLRDELGVTGPKAGCQQGGCGACTVLVDGEPRRSCLTPVAAVDGASITTVEGLSDGVDLAPVQRAFHEHHAAQCGFCTPGMLLATAALLERNPSPSRDEILESLGGHYCRCTGYVKILAAVESLAGGAS
jgi:aerobic-type carbon monoxide dehydrogenase small subunit (CoxS/CutS family)